MTTVCDNLTDQLILEFAWACTELAAVQLRQAQKDSTAHRAAVAAGRARIDDVLDMYLETGWAGR
jgi:hypothetical protein